MVVIFGTRPEGIKLAPLILEMRRNSRRIQSKVVVTAQHREMLDQVLGTFRIRPEVDLNLMRPGQDPADVAARILSALRPVLRRLKPDVVVVQGDTITTFAAALAAFLQKVPVAHVEAGLRTRDRYNPFPEEMSRRVASCLTDLHLAPTPWARDNLLREGIDRRDVVVTGNTVIDALFHVIAAKNPGAIPPLPEEGRLLLVTTHRRENFNAPLRNICAAVATLVKSVPDLHAVLPVHRNPNVDGPVRKMLGGRERIHLVPPLDYVPFVHLMSRAHIVLTDSGGVQEEAPSLGVPVLVARSTTERPEGIEAGVALLVGTERERIERVALGLLRDEPRRRRMAHRQNPYGDGRASSRIVKEILRRFPPGGRARGDRGGRSGAS